MQFKMKRDTTDLVNLPTMEELLYICMYLVGKYSETQNKVRKNLFSLTPF